MLKVGIIGCRNIGILHAQAYDGSKIAEVTACCDLSKERADDMATRFKAAPYYSMDEMFEHERLDVVHVCTGDTQHLEPVMKSLENGCHVLCEKPLDVSTHGAEQMIKEAEEKKLFLGTNFNRRFAEPYIRAKELMKKNELGKIAYLNVKLAQGGPTPESPKWAMWGKYDRARYYLLFELQVHTFDMLRHFGGEVQKLTAFFANPRDLPGYSSVAVSLEFEEGHVGTLLGSWDGSFTHPIESFEVGGTKGYAVVDNILDSLRVYFHGEPEYRCWKPSIFSRRDFSVTWSNHIQVFIENIAKGIPPPITGLDGLRALQIAEAAIESFETDKSVKPY